MKYLTEDLYKKMQLFQLPLQDGFTFEDLEELFDEMNFNIIWYLL